MANRIAPFTAVDFPKQYPQTDVAEHEVLMEFNGDEDAIYFQEWWHADGATRFAQWLARRKAEDQ